MGSKIDIIKQAVQLYVRFDDDLIEHIHLAALSAYTPHPINLCVMGPSSEGKSWAITHSLSVFPDSDLIVMAYASPTYFYHDFGILVNEAGEPIEDAIMSLRDQLTEERGKGKNADFEHIRSIKEELKKLAQSSKRLIDLTGKILVFLEQPPVELWNRLRPILSHDKREIEFRYTDRTEKNTLGTQRVVIRGWPAVIFAAAEDERTSIELLGQIRSRFVIVNPSMTVQKYKAANMLSAQLLGQPTFVLRDEFPQKTLDEAYNMVRRIRDILRSLTARYFHYDSASGSPKNITINPFAEFLSENFPADTGEDMRVLKQFLAYCNLEALYHVLERPILTDLSTKIDPDRYVLVTGEDVQRAWELIGTYARARTTKSRIEFFENVFIPAYNDCKASFALRQAKLDEERDGQSADFLGISASQVHEFAVANNLKPRGKNAKQTRQHMLTPLEEAGYITSKEDPNDRRRWLYRPAADNYAPVPRGIFGANFDDGIVKRALEKIGNCAPKMGFLLYDGTDLDQIGAKPERLDIDLLVKIANRGLISPVTETKLAPDVPQRTEAHSPEQTDNGPLSAQGAGAQFSNEQSSNISAVTPTTAGGKLTNRCWLCKQDRQGDFYQLEDGLPHFLCDDCRRPSTQVT